MRSFIKLNGVTCILDTAKIKWRFYITWEKKKISTSFRLRLKIKCLSFAIADSLTQNISFMRTSIKILTFKGQI